jgi:hypothetical protein
MALQYAHFAHHAEGHFARQLGQPRELIDQPHVRQRRRELHASHEQSPAKLPLELLNGLPEIPRTSFAFQSTRFRVLDTTYFFAASIVRAKGSVRGCIHSGLAPVRAGARHAASIISSFRKSPGQREGHRPGRGSRLRDHASHRPG